MYKIGVDLGGTNIVAGVINSEYKIIGRGKMKTNAPRPAEEIFADIAKCVEMACADAGISVSEVESVGIGTPGSVVKETGYIDFANNLYFTNVPAVEIFHKYLPDIRVYLENDANCAALGEAIAGTGVGRKSFVAVTHSPRYMLDMNVSREKSLFKRLGKSYDEIRHMKNPFDAFRTYMVDSKMKRNATSDGEDLWWFSPSIDEFSKLDLAEEKFASSLVNNKVKFWNKLSGDEKQEIKIEMLIASPSVLEGDYEYACQWLLQRNGVVCPSFRDNFSAGGRTVVNGVTVPQVIGKINEWKAEIAKAFNKKEHPQQYFEHWKTRVLSIGKFSSSEKDVLRKIVADIGKNIVY